MPDDVPDLALVSRIVRSDWFKFLFRSTVVAGGFVITAVGSFIWSNTYQVRLDVDRVQADVRELATITDEMARLHQAVDSLSADLSTVRLDTATMKGILQEMRRSPQAAAEFGLWEGPRR